jgi:hypothetical protein
MTPYKVGGKEKGMFKTVKNLSFLRVYGAGHTVPSFRKLLQLAFGMNWLEKEPN